MKVYFVVDLEGASGIVEFEDRKDESYRNIELRKKYWRLLAGEVNAAVAGAFDGGATEALVNDCHGASYTIDFELLDPRARVIHGRARPTWMAGLDASFAAMFSIAAHAMAGVRGGVLYHSFGAGVKWTKLNGQELGEIGFEAFCAGAVGVPLVLVTGDTAACREAETLIPNITTVAVKQGLSRFAAISHPPAKAHELIREGARKAVKRIKEVKPFCPPPPYVYQCAYFISDESTYKDVSDPANLPKQWHEDPEVRADTAEELIRKLWGAEV